MRIALALMTLATAASLYAQNAKPNFTGKYQADAAASDGAARRTRGQSLTVEHNEPKLRYLYQGSNRTREFNLTTDGSDQVRDEPNGESRMSARWDGNILEIRSFRKMQGGEMTGIERWSVGPGGALVMKVQTTAKPSGPESRMQGGTQEYTLTYRKASSGN